LILYTDLSYIHPNRCYIYIKGYSLEHLIFNSTFEKILKLIFNDRISLIQKYLNEKAEEYDIPGIKSKLNIGQDVDKIIILNIEDCNGKQFKLRLIKGIMETEGRGLDEISIEHKIKEKIENKISNTLNAINEINKIQEKNKQIDARLFKFYAPDKNYQVELSRKLYLYLIRKYNIPTDQLIEIDRYIRVTHKLYPNIDIYTIHLLQTKLTEKEINNLLVYAYLPLTHAYITQAKKLNETITDIIYEGPLGLENLK